jgi:hypothetical protein
LHSANNFWLDPRPDGWNLPFQCHPVANECREHSLCYSPEVAIDGLALLHWPSFTSAHRARKIGNPLAIYPHGLNFLEIASITVFTATFRQVAMTIPMCLRIDFSMEESE